MLKKIKSISYAQTGQFPQLFMDYIDGKNSLDIYYDKPPDLRGFEQSIHQRSSFDQNKRESLKKHFLKQYEGIEVSDCVKRNIDLISDQRTFTVTTGHQLNIFTGPLYFIYKCMTVIRLAEVLAENFKGKNFIPVYWMASEDHDFDEISFFNFDGKKYSWESDQRGAVGRFETKDLQKELGDFPIPEKYKTFYKNSSTLAEAHLKLVNELFSEFGLLILNPDSPELKDLAKDTFSIDISKQVSFEQVNKTNDALGKLNYNVQVNPREINYFLLEENLRERIELNKEGYFIQGEGGIRKLDLHKILSSSPEKISPNVVTRPLYQEVILPNLAYIGGPAELSYWLQFKSTFQKLDIHFPLLIPRFSASIIGNKALGKMKQIGINDPSDLFIDERSVLRNLLISKGYIESDKHESWDKVLNVLFDEVKKEAESKDKTLGASVEGRKKKVLKELDKIRRKMETAEIRNQEVLRRRFYYCRENLFPGGSFQERFVNVFEYLAMNPSFIEDLHALISNPLDYNHFILSQ